VVERVRIELGSNEPAGDLARARDPGPCGQFRSRLCAGQVAAQLSVVSSPDGKPSTGCSRVPMQGLSGRRGSDCAMDLSQRSEIIGEVDSIYAQVWSGECRQCKLYALQGD
jgi:hypothetical protein